MILYADRKSLLIPCDEKDPKTYFNSHQILSIGYYIKYVMKSRMKMST